MKGLVLGEADQIGDTLDYVREISWALETISPPDETQLRWTVDHLNTVLFERGENGPAILKSGFAFILPDHDADIEMLSEPEVRDSRVDDVLMKGKVDSIVWLGSVTFSGFGLRLFDVRYIQPHRRRDHTAFVPAIGIDLRLAA